MLEVLEIMNGRNVSLFSLAILSGRVKAVELIFDLVVRVFGHDQSNRNGERVVRFVDADGGDQGHQGQGQRDRGNQPHHDTVCNLANNIITT